MISTKCILITGTSRGLGAAIAQTYLLAGERVIGCSRGSTSIVNPNYLHYSLDVADELAVAEMFADLRAKSFVPRLLVNNAALDQKNLATLTSARVAKDSR
jgi:3-oxoacyl-[acyl-carrier protein] reductase